jgi:flagellar biosynthesis GTPase FlhF
VAKSNTDLSIGIEHNSVVPNEANNENQIWFINYGKELQGLVITNRKIESHYYDIHTALLNVFSNYSYTILILEGYMMALIKQTDFFYLFDSHARDSNGMPDPNGTAVVMKFANILELEQYLYSLSMTLHANLFEIVPVRLNICKASEQKSKSVKDREYVQKKRLLVENEGDKQARLKKASEYNKRKQSKETDKERQIRLQKASEYKKRKQSEETDRLQKLSESIKLKRSEETYNKQQIRLQKDRESKKRKRSDETDPNSQIRLQKDSEFKKRKRSEETDTNRQMRLEKDRLNKKQKRSKKVSQPQHEILNQQDYLNMFDTNNGGIEEQCWAKANINKFNKSVQYIVSQCTVCQKAWPLKSKPSTPYMCSRCFRDKKSPKKFSCEN